MNSRPIFFGKAALALAFGCALPQVSAFQAPASPDEPPPHEPVAGPDPNAVIPADPEHDNTLLPEDERERGRRFGRRPFGRERQRMDYDSLSDEERERFERFMETHFPERFVELTELSRTSPGLFDRIMDQTLPQMTRLMRMEKDDPQHFPLRVEEVKTSWQLRMMIRRLRETPDAEGRDRLRAEVRPVLERRFDVQQQLHAMEITKLERRLAETKAALDRRRADKDEIIARELEDVASGRLPPDGPPGGPMKERRPGRGRPPTEP